MFKKTIYISVVLIPVLSFSESVNLYEDTSYDKDVIYAAYYKMFENLEYMGVKPTCFDEYVDASKVIGRYVLPQTNDFVLYIIECPYENLSTERMIYAFRDLRGEIPNSYVNYLYYAGPLYSNNEIVDFYIYDIEMDIYYSYKYEKMLSTTGDFPGAIEFELLSHYLYETNYEDIEYLYNREFHVIAPESIPKGLQNGLSDEQKRLLETTLNKAYHRGSGYKNADEYWRFCTWSEYGGELILWEFYSLTYESLFTWDYEVIGVMGEYIPIDIERIYDKPFFDKYAAGFDEAVDIGE